jgi:hypothetical protein
VKSEKLGVGVMLAIGPRKNWKPLKLPASHGMPSKRASISNIEVVEPTPETFSLLGQGCQIFLGPNTPKRKNIPNVHKLYQKSVDYRYQRAVIYTIQMVIKCNNIFYSKALGILPKLGILA